jgi:hypothetical protein
MADEISAGDEAPPPPAGEAVHLPGPSYLPALTAAGVTVAVVGVVISWIVVALGAGVAGVAIYRWIRETRSDIAELPLEH